jgi:hypothetical protein
MKESAFGPSVRELFRERHTNSGQERERRKERAGKEDSDVLLHQARQTSRVAGESE